LRLALTAIAETTLEPDIIAAAASGNKP
jgi:hypothetical protein